MYVCILTQNVMVFFLIVSLSLKKIKQNKEHFQNSFLFLDLCSSIFINMFLRSSSLSSTQSSS